MFLYFFPSRFILAPRRHSGSRGILAIFRISANKVRTLAVWVNCTGNIKMRQQKFVFRDGALRVSISAFNGWMCEPPRNERLSTRLMFPIASRAAKMTCRGEVHMDGENFMHTLEILQPLLILEPDYEG